MHGTDLLQLPGEVHVSHGHTEGLQEHGENQNQHASLPRAGAPRGLHLAVILSKSHCGKGSRQRVIAVEPTIRGGALLEFHLFKNSQNETENNRLGKGAFQEALSILWEYQGLRRETDIKIVFKTGRAVCVRANSCFPSARGPLGVLWLCPCPGTVLIPGPRGCISSQQLVPERQSTDLTIHRGHSSREMQAAWGEVSFVISPRSLGGPMQQFSGPVGVFSWEATWCGA